MKKLFAVLALNLLLQIARGQNLVANSDFEIFSTCPTNIGQVPNAQGWTYAQCSPDYFSSCSTNTLVSTPSNGFGSQSPHSGNAYVGGWMFSPFPQNGTREYIETAVTNSLSPGHKYAVSFFISLSDNSEYSISSIGAFFSTFQISNGSSACNRLAHIPQILNKSTNQLSDKSNWTLISDTMVANGGEAYMTIGNFNYDSLSDTLFLGNTGGFTSAYYYIDDVSVIDLGPSGIQPFSENKSIVISPNPTKGVVNISGCKSTDHYNVEVYDLSGRLILKPEVSLENGMGRLELDVENGLYLLHLSFDEHKGVHKILISK